MGQKPALPDSRSGEFWAEAEIIKCEPEVHTANQVHSWQQEGVYAVCTTCPNPHGIFLDIISQEVRGGDVVHKQSGKVIYGRSAESNNSENVETVDKSN